MITWSRGTGSSSGTSTPVSSVDSQRASGVGGPSTRDDRASRVSNSTVPPFFMKADTLATAAGCGCGALATTGQ